MEYRDASPADDDVLVAHYLAVWRSYGVPETAFTEDASEIVRTFLVASRTSFLGGAVLALSDNIVVGSAAYQLQTPQFPEVLRPAVRQMGYIWSVYVQPNVRRTASGQGW